LSATLAAIDVVSLQQQARTSEQPLRILDVACGTGLLLAQLAHLFPTAELYGIDASQPMLDQAAHLLQHHPQIHLSHTSLTGDKTAGLPYDPASFDLITFTNTLHYLKAPQATLKGLSNLLVPDGQMVVEDYLLRGFPYPWRAFEWAIKLYDPQHVRLYTLSGMQEICRSIDLQVIYAKSFSIDLFCQGWVLRTSRSYSQI
jgi:ubiquinone/menaquinone biosynthesis C-methylase UbiE